MEIQKQFSFVGNLKKRHEKDDQPIENFKAIIYCNKNGTIFMEIDSTTSENLNQKRFYESAPIYKLKNTIQFPKDEIFNPFLFVQVDELEKELIQTPYEGDYIIEGKTFEGWVIKANIADASFRVSFGNLDAQQSAEKEKKYLIRLSDLHIDYNPQYIGDKILESTYGISNLEVLSNFSTYFLDSKHEFSLISLYRDNKDAENLSAEMKFRVIDENNIEEISYDTYFAWFELLISFATGECIKKIYKIETIQTIGGQKKIEFWSGDQTFIKGRGITVIQQPHLHLFIKQCASKVTLVNFGDKGLGSALRWYVEGFTSNTVSVEFILLCTVLETLKKHHSFVGSFRESIKQMLEFYKVPYKDLFLDLEFIKTRNKIIHEGFGGLDAAPELRKLANLIVRLILSILEYQGDYMESRRIEIEDEMGCSKHGLICKTFPFEDEC